MGTAEILLRENTTTLLSSLSSVRHTPGNPLSQSEARVIEIKEDVLRIHISMALPSP